MPVDIPETLTRKLGPLPAWGWGVAIGGAILVARLFRGKSATPAATTGTASTTVGGSGMIGTGPDATPTDVFSGANSLVQQLQTQVGDLTTQLTGQQGQVAGLQTQVGDLTTQLTGQQGQVAGLSGTISTLTDFQTLQTKLSGLLNTRATNLSHINSWLTNINTYQDNLKACTTAACKSKWNAEIAQKQGYITTTNAGMVTLDSQIKDTQTQLNAMGTTP